MHAKTVARRAQTIEKNMGGGVTEPSVTDTVDVSEHFSGDDDVVGESTIDLDYMNNYGFSEADELGTGAERPTPDPYTFAEAKRDIAEFSGESETYRRVRDTSDESRYGTIELPANSEPYLIAGDDPWRKSITIRNQSSAVADMLVDVIVGNNAGLPNRLGAGGFWLKGANSVTQLPGQDLVLTTTDEVWVVQLQTESLTEEAVKLSYVIERYHQQ